MVIADLHGLHGYVQQVASANVAHAEAIATAAAMTLRKVGARHKRDLAIQQVVSGTVKVVAKATKGGRSYEWQSSTDGGKTWVSLPPTAQSSTTVTGLTPGVLTHFRQRVVTKAGPGDWSEPSSPLFVAERRPGPSRPASSRSARWRGLTFRTKASRSFRACGSWLSGEGVQDLLARAFREEHAAEEPRSISATLSSRTRDASRKPHDSTARTRARSALHDAKRRNVALDHRARRDERAFADPDELRDARESAERDVVFDDDVPRELHRVRDHAVRADHDVVGDVSAHHEERSRADARGRVVRPPMHRDVLAKNIVVADVDARVARPPDFLSCGGPPSAKLGEPRCARPSRVGPGRISACAPMRHPGPMRTPAPMTA